MIIHPMFYEQTGDSIKNYDVYSRLLKDRVILLFHEVTDDLACTVISQMLYLEAMDASKDICLYINTPGGSVSAGLAIYDTMRNLKCDVKTICVGMASSMGAFLLAGGTKGKRYALANSQVMIHQVLGGTRGQASDIEIEAAHILSLKGRMNNILAANTGHTVEEIESATDRNTWLFAEEALAYGLIDQVIGAQAA